MKMISIIKNFPKVIFELPTRFNHKQKDILKAGYFFVICFTLVII
ncbi:MAG: hypothetical protein PWQ77_1944 [Kosmotogales bacterium]|nr:hypothetical protein [Kosmotogales bacterium]